MSAYFVGGGPKLAVKVEREAVVFAVAVGFMVRTRHWLCAKTLDIPDFAARKHSEIQIVGKRTAFSAIPVGAETILSLALFHPMEEEGIIHHKFVPVSCTRRSSAIRWRRAIIHHDS